MNKNKILGVVVIIIILIVIVFLYTKTSKGQDYSIVYLSTGEVYIGKLTTFPDLQLKDSYILQVTPDPTDPKKNNFQLQPIKDALWAPQSLHLIKKNIVFYGPLSPESSIAKKLAEQEK